MPDADDDDDEPLTCLRSFSGVVFLRSTGEGVLGVCWMTCPEKWRDVTRVDVGGGLLDQKSGDWKSRSSSIRFGLFGVAEITARGDGRPGAECNEEFEKSRFSDDVSGFDVCIDTFLGD